MKRGPVTLLIAALVLGTGVVSFPAGSQASTAVREAETVLPGPTAGIRTMPQAPGRMGEAGTVSGRQRDIAFKHPACQREITGDESGVAGGACNTAADSRQPFSIQLGRRIGTRNEILGEFDGVRVDYRLTDGLMLNGIAGYPVLTAEDVFNPARQVFGFSATTGAVADTWELNGYLAEQQEDGRVVGRSLGGAMRYLRPGHSLLAYLDYDPVRQSIGTLMASGALKLPFRTTLSATLDLQQRPIPVLQKKYLTQSMTVMDGWDWILPDDRLALHTTGGSNEVGLLAVDLSYALSRRIRLRGDVILLDVAHDTDAAAGIDTSEYHYHLKITGRDLMRPGDRSRLDLRHSVTDTGRSYTATFDTRYAIKRFWNFISELRADYHRAAEAGTDRWEASPKVKMEYRPSKQFGFHIEAGGSVSDGERAGAAEDRSSYYVSLGYRVDF